MKKVNKIIAMLICISILSSICSIMGYAFEDEEEFSIENYTWNDIMTMSNADFRELLTNFERVYDPFGTYETNPITAIYDENGNSSSVQPRWTSGNEEHSETGSHELITARACGIVLDDKGFWGSDENGSILIALIISLASIIPDTNNELGLQQLFEGHFYDPETGKSFTGSATNTAKTNAQYFYNQAKTVGFDNENFLEYVGCMLHYVQDACVPHHAANITGLNLAHPQFESFADDNLNSYIDSLTTINESVYNDRLDKSIGTIVHDSATVAKGFSSLVDNIFDKTHWGTVAMNTTRLAVIQSATVLYKLSIDAGIPLTK